MACKVFDQMLNMDIRLITCSVHARSLEEKEESPGPSAATSTAIKQAGIGCRFMSDA